MTLKYYYIPQFYQAMTHNNLRKNEKLPISLRIVQRSLKYFENYKTSLKS
jgi:hypothetical protein